MAEIGKYLMFVSEDEKTCPKFATALCKDNFDKFISAMETEYMIGPSGRANKVNSLVILLNYLINEETVKSNDLYLQ